MDRCIFCQKCVKTKAQSRAQTNIKFCHFICEQCKHKVKVSKNSEYCHSCFNEYLLNRAAIISVCKIAATHGNGEIGLCENHAYCSGCIKKPNQVKKITCEICLKSLKNFCIICFQFCEKDKMMRLHKNHSYCTSCKDSINTKLSCNQCKVETQNDTFKYQPPTRDNFYFPIHDKILNNPPNVVSTQVYEQLKISKNVKPGTKYEVSSKYQNKPPPPSNKSKNIESNFSQIPKEYQNSNPQIIEYNRSSMQYTNPSNNTQVNYLLCREHQLECNSYIPCLDHLHCGYCIVYYLAKKFNQFIKNINASNFEWLYKLHKYGCYYQGCKKANYSFQYYQYVPILREYIQNNDLQTHYLFNLFIPYAEGFMFTFIICKQCHQKSAILPDEMCYACLYKQLVSF